MKKNFRTLKYLSLLCIIIIAGQAVNLFAQDGFGAAKLITTDEQIQMTFHKASTTGVLQSTPLTTEQVDAGFKSGNAVGIRYMAPFDSYVYIVNVSEWDGTTLQYPQTAAQNSVIAANTAKDFAFLLENITHNPTTGREEILVMVTKTKIENPELETVLRNPEKKIIIPSDKAKEAQISLKNSLTAPIVPSPAPSVPRKNKFKTAISVACNITSLFFPFAKVACTAAGFGAAKYISAPGNALGIVADQQAETLTMRVSFAVTP